jgi:hypothetical protein
MNQAATTHLPSTLAALVMALEPELQEIARKHRAEREAAMPPSRVQAMLVHARAAAPRVHCLRNQPGLGRARRPGSRRATATRGARADGVSDDGDGGSSGSDDVATPVRSFPAAFQQLQTKSPLAEVSSCLPR